MNAFFDDDSFFEFDLWAAHVRDGKTGRVVASFPGWKAREKVIVNELYQSSHFANGSHLFDLLPAYPDWISRLSSFQKLRDLLDPVCWRLNSVLRYFKLHIGTVGIARMGFKEGPPPTRGSGTAARPDRDLRPWEAASQFFGQPFAITARPGIDALRRARQALEESDYAGAAVHAVVALTHLGESRYARLFIGSCCFCFGQAIDNAVVADTAGYLVKLQRNLEETRDTLARLWRRATDERGRWPFVPEFISMIEEQLLEFCELFRRGRQYLFEE